MVGYDLFMALGELSTIYIGYGWTINHSNYDSNVDYDGLLSAINICDLWLWWLVMVMMVIYSYDSHKKKLSTRKTLLSTSMKYLTYVTTMSFNHL